MRFLAIFSSSVLSLLVVGHLTAQNVGKTYVGGASYYAKKFEGRKTANGEVFDQNKLTAAHNQLPYGSKVKVTNLANNQSVIVKINDRMAQHNRNIIDVTKHAAKRLGFFGYFRARVILERIQ